MTSDLLEYLNGNVVLGLMLIPFLGGLFTFVWWVTWKGTGFWGLGRFWRVIAIGWLVIIAGYITYWRLIPPESIPIRVFVRAGDGVGQSPGAWSEGVADGIKNRLRAAPEPFVVQDEESAGVLFSTSSKSELDGIAAKMRIKYQVIVTQDSVEAGARPPVKISILSRSGNSYKSFAEFIAPDVSLATLSAWAGEAVAQKLGGVDLKGRSFSRLPNLPDSVLEVHYLAFSVRRQGENDLAAALFMAESNDDTTWSAPKIEFARTWLSSSPDMHEQEIRTALLEAASIDRNNPEIYILLGRHFLDFRDWDEAESALKLAYMLDFDDPRIYFYLSRLMENRFGDLPIKTSRAMIERALQLAPGYETARLAQIEKMRTVYEKRQLTKLIEDGLFIDPHSRLLLVTASALYIELHEYTRASQHCQTLLADNPTDHEALYNLGLCLLWQNHYDESIAMFDSSRRNGGTVENLYYIGVVHQFKKDYHTAIEWFQKRYAAAKNQEDQGAISSRARIGLLREKILADSLRKTGWTPPDLFEQDAERKALRKGQ